MVNFTSSTLLAVFLGFALLPVLFTPYVAWSYRSRGTLGGGHAVLSATAVVYALTLWTYAIAPIPRPAELSCATGGVPPQLVPFASFATVNLSKGLSGSGLLHDIQGVLLFVPFGMLGRHLFAHGRALRVVVAGAGASLLLELTQLTGVWGVYPCAYRQFDVDDIITNLTGTLIGVALAPLLRLVPGQRVLPRNTARIVKPGRRLVGMEVDVAIVTMAFVLVSVGLTVVGKRAGWIGDTFPYSLFNGLTLLAVSMLALLVVPWFSGGASIGQRLTYVRPVTLAGEPPGRLAILLRWATGSGGFFALFAAATITDWGILTSLAIVWGLAAVAVVLVKHPRGLSGFASGLTVADAREADPDASVADEVDPRSLGVGVMAVLATVGLGFGAFIALTTLLPIVGIAIGVLGVVVLVAGTVAFVPYLITNGVTVIRREGVSLASALPLLAALAFVALPALFGVALASGSAPFIAVMLAALAVTGYLGFLFVAFLAYGIWYARQRPNKHADAVVVLGSRVFGDHVPPLLAARIDRGIGVLTGSLDDDPGRPLVLVCSGGKGSDESAAEGDAMGAYAIAHGAPEERVLRETASRNTEENLTLSRDLLRQRGLGTSMIVVTNDFHAFRAGIIAREIGVDAQVIGAPTAHYYFPSAVIREFVGVLARTPLLHGAVAAALGVCAAAVVAVLVR